MSPRSDIPEPWRSAMEDAGMYSLRDVAHRTGLATTTVSGLVYGRRQSDERTIQTVADALRVPVTTTRRWAVAALGEVVPFELPPEANQLNRRQREAILTVVRAMIPSSEEQEPAGQLVDFARPTLPDPVVDPIAAQRGESIGRRMRDEQDENPGT